MAAALRRRSLLPQENDTSEAGERIYYWLIDHAA